MKNKEQKLADRLVKKEEMAWKEFFEAYSGNLTYVCSRYIIDKEDINDVLQNSFVKMFSSISSFEYRGEGSLKAWITKIVVNESLQQIKKKLDFKEVSDDFEIPDEEKDEDSDFEEISQKIIMEMIRALPDGYRTVFNLYVFEKKSHKEIADILNIAENSSASQFHRAKSVLVKKIKEYKLSKMIPYG